MRLSPGKLALMIDHTNLHADASKLDIEKLCDEGKMYNFNCVCVNPANIELAVKNLLGSKTGICSVIGFPLGAVTSKAKICEAEEAVLSGASQLDMVMNIGQLKSGREDLVKQDIQGVVEAADGRTVKVILETALLTEEEKVEACLISREAGAGFVKTSTGFSGLGGATVEDIKLIKKIVGNDMGIKASGGIKNLKQALELINAGADRIGTSGGVQIMEEYILK